LDSSKDIEKVSTQEQRNSFKDKLDEATETFKGQCFMLHVESHVDGQDDLGQSYEDADKKVAEGSQNRI
jgi:hypothetical protein